VCLICFQQPYRHAKHYMGWTTDLDARLRAHAVGRGARLMEVITAAGIGFTLARTWPGTRNLERRLKNRGGHARLCRSAKRPNAVSPATVGPESRTQAAVAQRADAAGCPSR
jgi:hypothetical protein